MCLLHEVWLHQHVFHASEALLFVGAGFLDDFSADIVHVEFGALGAGGAALVDRLDHQVEAAKGALHASGLIDEGGGPPGDTVMRVRPVVHLVEEKSSSLLAVLDLGYNPLEVLSGTAV